MSNKYCTNCGEIRIDNQKFCGNCGKQHYKKEQSPSKPFTTSQKDLEAFSYHRNYLNRVSTLSAFIIALIIVLGIAVLALSIYSGFGGNEYYTIRMVIFIAFICVVGFSGLHERIAKSIIHKNYPHDEISMKQMYYKLPSSRDENGKWQCIYCGGKRFHKKGVYASDSIQMHCSNCQTGLYIDH
ncbi:MAG: hypothetical protein RR677_03575 [Acinetobacter sp.]